MTEARARDLPEAKLYSDDGCHVHPHCLSCPLPVCIYDEPVKKSKARFDEIHLRLQRGMSAAAVARELSISVRTVWRRMHNVD